ncbi:1-aminocyclopropane-1-carboxylate deaminase/D-cysteine desulfhydrase [Streptomyces sp. H34-S4]|uniref:1-aminocyclopropane-1-carboxylate deaminase/D-cysteine desulfhydrase n=1 Tax=Streptomyces sp. H34-S4 TaxID=2996463 RepID=UPI00226DE760|nr:pyridoxal-phosphate dependent enzyme [Streptomyces sp. H34-S4]MCY0933936.1 pyridoxal-phosphate dependent enzyme [Streptomyces sp. H34-S4]
MTYKSLSDVLPHLRLPSPRARGRVPTPLDEHEGISRDLGARVLIKREDLIDDLGGGHKARKLAYVAEEAVARGADVLVTGGSVPSGQCVAVAATARGLGIAAHLVYCGDNQRKPARPQGSYLLALLLGHRVTWYERTAWARIDELLAEAAAKESAEGRIPHIIPPGLHTWPGILGSIDLGLELAAQLARTPDGAFGVQVVAPCGSGTTALGLSIASHLLGLGWTVHGIRIGGSAEGVRAGITALRADTARRTGDSRVLGAEVVIHDSALGEGYDHPTDAQISLMHDLLMRHQLVFDPNYMVKTFDGLRIGLRSGAVPRTGRVVLVHTGGNLGIHGDSPQLQDWYRWQLGPSLAPDLS